MTDRLTQLQNAIDQLAVQFYSAMHYLDTHHDFVPLEDEPKVSDPQAVTLAPLILSDINCLELKEEAKGTKPVCCIFANERSYRDLCDIVVVDDAAVFDAAKSELASDLMVKTRQIDLLISSLPGAGVSATDQLARVRKLEAELENVEVERLQWAKRRQELLSKCDSVILELSRCKNEIGK
ncbi:mediator complex, subunit Med21 [Dipodascopsis uninucleata]